MGNRETPVFLRKYDVSRRQHVKTFFHHLTCAYTIFIFYESFKRIRRKTNPRDQSRFRRRLSSKLKKSGERPVLIPYGQKRITCGIEVFLWNEMEGWSIRWVRVVEIHDRMKYILAKGWSSIFHINSWSACDINTKLKIIIVVIN